MFARVAAEGNGGVDGGARRDAEQQSEQDNFETHHRFGIGPWPDKAWRVCVPEEMRARRDQNEATLVGLLDRFEIWDPARYEQVKAADAVLAQEAFKLME